MERSCWLDRDDPWVALSTAFLESSEWHLSLGNLDVKGKAETLLAPLHQAVWPSGRVRASNSLNLIIASICLLAIPNISCAI